MTTKIKLKKSSVSSNAPGTGDLDYGELAINYADGRLYYKNSSNVIKNFIDSDLVISTINELSLDSAQTLALFSGGTGVTFNTGEISIGQGVATTDSPTFAGLTVNGDIVVSGGTLTDLTLSGSITEEVYAWTTTTGAITTELEPDNGTIQTVTLTGNVTSLTDNFSSGQAITLHITDGGFTIAWPTMTWVNNGGSAPDLSTPTLTIVSLWKVGSTLYGALVGDGS